MLYILSKTVNILINPLLWIIIIQIFIHISKKKSLKKRFITINIFLLLIFSNGHLVKFFIQKWEYNVRPMRSLNRENYFGIVPGGFSNYFPKSERLQFNCSNDRLMQTLLLYKHGIIKKIIIAGGSGRIMNQAEKESIYVKNFIKALDIPNEDILIESNSRNTYENAKFVSELYGNDTSKYILITSALHMRRALPCFKKFGLNVEPYPVNFMYGPEKEKGDFWNGFIPSSSNISLWSVLFKEYIGTLSYKIRGYHKKE